MNRARAVPLRYLIPSGYAIVRGLAGLMLAALRGLRDGSLLEPQPGGSDPAGCGVCELTSSA